MDSKMTFAAARRDPRYISVSDGNLKLKPDAETKYIIWNLPARVTCPFATKHCKGACYACKAERCYPSARESRRRHLEISKRDDFVDRMIFTIRANLNRKGYRKAKRIVVRIHESGDFYSFEYAMKWLRIAAAFVDDPRVVFMAYTKSIVFFRGAIRPDNLVLRFSVWDDTPFDQIAMAARMGLPIYTAVDKFTNETEQERCLCENCSTCNKCWDRDNATIKCEIH